MRKTSCMRLCPLSFAIALSCVGMGVAASGDQLESNVPHGRIGYDFEHIERIEYDDTNPLEEEYDWGRLAGQRHLLSFGVEALEEGYVGAIIGPSVIQVHNGEGETIEYRPVCLGLEGGYRWDCLPQYRVGALFHARGLAATKDKGKITEVSRASVPAKSSSELSWWELSLLAAVTYDHEHLRMKAGLEYVAWAIEQSWTIGTGSATTDLEPEKNLGILLGAQYQCTDALSLSFDVTLIHQVTFRGGVSFDF
ncbi:MAG: hypothetical protein HN341_06690 [Verrucomicrobia bacterium]|jgi:hypothetical protein|nr:hypothetical protein [Verrucomicrobiota bacterium]